MSGYVYGASRPELRPQVPAETYWTSQRVIRSTGCPHCDVRVGRPCVTAAGGTAAQPHTARRRAAFARGVR